MTDDRTPLQRLDDAVHDFVAALDEDGALAGWTLVYQTQYLDPEVDPERTSPVDWDAGYSISPGLSPFAAVGLLDHLRGRIADVYRDAHDDEDEA